MLCTSVAAIPATHGQVTHPFPTSLQFGHIFILLFLSFQCAVYSEITREERRAITGTIFLK
jgi:hypothetical protein